MFRYHLIYLLILLFFLFPRNIYAESSYVLPYPGVMPGSKLYVFKEMKNYLDGFWYFGDISQFKYNLLLSDEYLVESRILFEYKQFFLALRSLRKSSRHYVDASKYVDNALRSGKDVVNIEDIYKSAEEKHKEVLIKLKKELPEFFFWNPENQEGSELFLYKEIDRAISELR